LNKLEAKMARQESKEQMGIFKNVAKIMVVSPEKKVSTTPIKRCSQEPEEVDR